MSKSFLSLAALSIATFAAALGISVAPLRSSAQAPVTSGMAVLRPGDVLRIEVWQSKEFSGDFTIAADGTILHPLLREVHVGGEPMSVVEDRVRAFLLRFQANPQFVLQPLLRVAVGGEVRQPNLYSFPPQTTIVQAVALAGGPTEAGRLDRVRLVRDGRETILDLTSPQGGPEQMTVQSGDQILVERRSPPVFSTYILPAVGVTTAIVTILTYLKR